MRNALRSSKTLFRPRSMKSSNRVVNCAMRSRRSLKPKSMLGRVSAIEGALALVYGACEPENELPKRLGVNVAAAMFAIQTLSQCFRAQDVEVVVYELRSCSLWCMDRYKSPEAGARWKTPHGPIVNKWRYAGRPAAPPECRPHFGDGSASSSTANTNHLNRASKTVHTLTALPKLSQQTMRIQEELFVPHKTHPRPDG